MSRQGSLAKNTLLLSIGTILPKFGSIIMLPILTGCLTQAEYGTYDLVSVLVSLILPTVTLQIRTATFRFLVEVKENTQKKTEIITTITVFTIIISTIALAILYFAIPVSSWLSKFLICGYFFADNFTKTLRQVARGFSRNDAYSISATISPVCQLIFVTIFVLLLSLGLNGVLLAFFLASSFSGLFLIFKLKIWKLISYKSFSLYELKELLKYSWPMVPAEMSMWIMRLSDRFVITFTMGVTANAVYAVAHKIPSLLTLAQNTFALAWQENATLASKDDDVSEYYSTMFLTMYNLMAGFLGVIVALTPVLFIILVRGGYGEAYTQMPILLLAMFFYAMSDFIGGIFVAFKNSKMVGLTTVLAAIINLVINISLIKHIGLYAASFSTLISYIFLFIFRFIAVKKNVQIKCNLWHLIWVLLLLILECVLCFFKMNILNLINIVISVVIFLVLNKSIIKILIKRIFKILKIKI